MLAALGCGAIAAPGPSAAADPLWSGSYAAAGACHCTGELDPDVAAREVDTPSGRRTVARVCEAVGAGPGLRFENGRWSHAVYPDAQCGHGPFASGVELLDPECAGMRGPNAQDCRPVGPTWDLESAFAAAPGEPASDRTDREAAVAAIEAATPPGGIAEEIVQIDGRFWRRAPDGTAREGGRSGDRIILDGDLWLSADDPRFAEADALDVTSAADVRWEEAPKRSFEPDFGVADEVRMRTAPVATAPLGPERSGGERNWSEAPAESFDRDFAAADGERTGGTAEAVSPTEPEPLAGERTWAEAPEASFDPEFVAPERRSDGTATATLTAEAADADAPDPDDGPATLAAALPADGPVAEIGVDPANEADDGEGTSPADADDAASSVESSAEAVSATAPGESTAAASAPVSALRLPADARGSSDEFGYVEAMPKTYDIGGSGLGLEASGEAAERFHFLLRGAAAESYQEMALGVGVHVTPAEADRVTLALTAGVEYGVFELSGTDAEGNALRDVSDDDVGGFVALSGRLVLTSRFELTGGVGYSGFHEGDPHGFGGAFFHVNRRLDLMSRFEVGDNDQLGIGLRYYY